MYSYLYNNSIRDLALDILPEWSMGMYLIARKSTHDVIVRLVHNFMKADIKAVLKSAPRYKPVIELSLHTLSMYLV